VFDLNAGVHLHEEEVHARHKTNEGRIVIDKHPQISGEIS
jgi:hypothetical protein